MNLTTLQNPTPVYIIIYSILVHTLYDPSPLSLRPIRMETKESCDKVIDMLNGVMLPGSKKPLVIKFADSSHMKKQSQSKRVLVCVRVCILTVLPWLHADRWRAVQRVSVILCVCITFFFFFIFIFFMMY